RRGGAVGRGGGEKGGGGGGAPPAVTHSNPLQRGGVEAVEAAHARIRVGKVAGKRPQIAVRGQPLGAAVDFTRRDRLAAQVWVVSEEIADDLDAFLRLERAGAIDENPTRLPHPPPLAH